jgi:RNase adaptor protein for sRNA GlmZ degradation
MAVSLQSFSYKRGLPRGVDMIFDCRMLDNPYWTPALRDLDGRDPADLTRQLCDGVSDIIRHAVPCRAMLQRGQTLLGHRAHHCEALHTSPPELHGHLPCRA